MWTFEQAGIMKNSTAPRSFTVTDCDEMVSQRKKYVHSLRKCQKSILNSDFTFCDHCNLCQMRVAENVEVV